MQCAKGSVQMEGKIGTGIGDTLGDHLAYVMYIRPNFQITVKIKGI